MRHPALCKIAVVLLLLAVPALSITINEAQRIATDQTGGIARETEQRSENGTSYYFVKVDVNGKNMVVKIGANNGKVYEISEWKAKK